jgi:signal transduction histidine kinase
MQHEGMHATWPLPVDQLRPALELARALARADMTVLLLHDEIAGVVVPAAAQGLTDAQAAMLGPHRPGEDAFGLALTQRRRIVVRDVPRREKNLAEIARSVGFRTLEIIPLIGLNDEIVGEIVMMYRRARCSSRKMFKLIEHCARLVVMTVQHARRAMEAERAREAAEQVGRAKIQFLARMSHELRTPLQSIAGYIDLLRVGGRDSLTPEQARMLARVHDSEEILVHVIDDLITFSRLEAGHVVYHIAPVAADEVIRITQSVVTPLALGHGIRLEADACSGIFVASDGDKLKQILVNLAANAVKFTKGGVVRISCSTQQDSVRFDVADNGPGIAPDKLRQIFEPYVQLNGPLLDRFGGTGLGLAISREFAAGMRGDLTVRSEVGRGSVFSLTLPRASVREAPQMRTRSHDSPPPAVA